MSNPVSATNRPQTPPDHSGSIPTSGPVPILSEEQSDWDLRLAATGLRNALRLNGEFSLTTGLAATIFAGPLAELLGVEQIWLVRSVGVALLGFAAGLFLLAGQRTSLVAKLALAISAADLGWVAATVVLIALGWLSSAGAVLMGLIALVVLGFAMLQLRAQRATVADGGSAVDDRMDEYPPVEVVQSRRPMAAEVTTLWPIITDHELYARLAANLGAAAGLTPNGSGMRRTCTDSAGRSWSETCTLWEEGRRFDISVDIDGSADAEAYPYPLQLMEGSWAVAPQTEPPEAGTSMVTMRFAFQPKPGLRGRLFVPLMHLMFRPILARIMRGWQRESTRR